MNYKHIVQDPCANIPIQYLHYRSGKVPPVYTTNNKNRGRVHKSGYTRGNSLLNTGYPVGGLCVLKGNINDLRVCGYLFIAQSLLYSISMSKNLIV